MFNIFKRAAKGNGIFTVSTPFVHRITGGAFVFTMNERGLDKMSKINPIFDPLAGFVPQLKQDIQQAKAAKSFFKSTGLAPIFMSPDTPKEELGEMLRHEMIHAAHMTNPDHVFFKQALQDAPSLSKVLNKEFGNAPIRLQTIIRKSYADQLRALKTDKTMNAKFVRDTERLAYSNMRDESFLLRAEEHGIKTHLSIAKYISHGEHTAPGRSKSLIQGLRDSGFACYMRKILSRFGSGWQGQPQMGAPEKFLKIVGATESSIKETDLQHGRYQDPSQLEDLVEAFRQKRQVEPVEIFLDEYKNVIGAEGRHRALAAMKAGVKEIPIVIRKRASEQAARITKTVMETGEGSAIVKAGTSTIPNVLKATSRIMKSAL